MNKIDEPNIYDLSSQYIRDFWVMSMRYLKRFISIVLFSLLLLSQGGLMASAMHTGFLLEPVSEEVKESFPAAIKLSFLTSGHQKRTIQCFDVNEDGMIAIGCERLSKKYVGVYTNDGHFQYGYEFECSSSFGVEWDGDDLIIYFVRSDIALAVNSSGEVVGIGKIPNTFASNSYWHNSVFLTRRTVGDTQYVIKNDMGPLNLVASSYSQLVMISPDGTENILYDVNTDHMIAVSLVLSGIIVFVSICGIRIWRAWKKPSITKGEK